MSNDSAQVAHLKRQCKTVITPLAKKRGYHPYTVSKGDGDSSYKVIA